jgi:hypothetical protein
MNELAQGIVRRPRTIRWPPRLARLLGKLPDGEVARLAGVNFRTVANERKRRGIPPAHPLRPRVQWTEAMIALLGTAIDKDVAAELGIPLHCVVLKRLFEGIPPFGHSTWRRRTFWTPRRLALLGTAPDAKIARRLGISTSAVSYRRRRLGIAPFAPLPPRPRWTRAMLRLLGLASDPAVATRLGLSARTVRRERRQRGIPPYERHRDKLVRTAKLAAFLRRPTGEVCRRAGLRRGTVYQLRKELGVPTPPRPSAWTPRALAQLGKLPDAVLARQLGLSVAWVARKRQQQGLGRSRWTPEEERHLGTASDREVAKRIGRSAEAVKLRRLSVARRRAA